MQLSDISVSVATEDDIYKIYEFARGRYEESRINGPEIKLPWWKVNSNIFYVIHDKDGSVCANINLLPLKHECYERLKQGKITEKCIHPNDIYSTEERSLVSHIYVEGFNCKYKSMAYIILHRLESLLSNLVYIEDNTFCVGAIGGTKEGERIMINMGFQIISNNAKLLGKNFLEINSKSLFMNIHKK